MDATGYEWTYSAFESPARSFEINLNLNEECSVGEFVAKLMPIEWDDSNVIIGPWEGSGP